MAGVGESAAFGTGLLIFFFNVFAPGIIGIRFLGKLESGSLKGASTELGNGIKDS